MADPQQVVVDPSEVQALPIGQSYPTTNPTDIDPADVTAVQDPEAIARLERSPGIPLYQMGPGPAPKELPPLTPFEAMVTNPAKQVGSGFMSGAAAATHLTKNIAGLLDSAATSIAGMTGTQKGDLFKHIEEWAKGQQEAQEQSAAELAGGRKDLPSQLFRVGSSAATSLPTFGTAAALGGPVGGMAALGALENADQGWKGAAKGAIENALAGGALTVMGPASRPIRLAGGAAMTYAQLRLQGVDHETALANAMTMGGMSAIHPGGATAREILGPRLPNIGPLVKNRLNPVEQASQDYLTEHGIETPLSMQTGSRPIANLEGAVQQGLGGGYAAEARAKTKQDIQNLGQQELGRITKEPVTPEEAGTAIGQKLSTDLEKQRSTLAGQVSPTPSSPELAGTKVLEAGKKKIRQFDQAADESYKAAWQAEKDPRNIEQVPVRDKDGGQVLKPDGTPETESMALPIDMRALKDALAPLADRYEYTLRETDARSSLGLKSMRNIINGPDFKPASAAELDLGMLKEAARTEKGMAELRDQSQGLAAASVKQLQQAIGEKMAQARYPGWDPASGTPSPALRHLEAGRRNTAEKYAIADTYAQFGRQNLEDLEPVGVHRALTWGGDAGIQRLRDIAAIAPETMPDVGRAFIDGGGKWDTLGPETKKVLFRDPELIKKLDEYYAKEKQFGPLTKLEPVALFDKLTSQRGRTINQLREVAQEAPEQMPHLARAFVQELLDRTSREGDIQKIQSTLDKWMDMSPESKNLLLGDPKMVKDWDNFFFSLKRLGREVNPSGTGYVNAVNKMKGDLLRGVGAMAGAAVGGLGGSLHGAPAAGGAATAGAGLGFAAGAGAEVGLNALLARMLFDPKWTRLLTKGINERVAGNEAGVGLTARTLARMAKEEPPKEPPAQGPGTPALNDQQHFLIQKRASELLPEMQGTPEGWREKLNQASDNAQKRIDKFWKEQGTTLNMRLPVDVLADYSILGARKIVDGAEKFGDWSKAMIDAAGEQVRPNLRAIWKEAQPIADRMAGMRKADRAAGSEQSTRVPTAVKATEDPISNVLTTGYESWKRDPEMMKKNVNAMLEYPNFRGLREQVRSGKVSIPDAAEQIIGHIQENLQWLHDAMPEEFRDRARLWYDGANKIAKRWAGKYGATPEQVAGLMAVTSPGTDWFINAERARRMLDFWPDRDSKKWHPRMEATWRDKLSSAIPEDIRDQVYKDIRGKGFKDVTPEARPIWFRLHDEAINPREYHTLNPEGTWGEFSRTEKGALSQFNWADFNQIAKGLGILENGSKENIHEQLGLNHKIRNFYNNIINPNSAREHTTIDTHAVGAGLMRPISQMSVEAGQNFGGSGASSSSISGEKGTYGLWKEAYRRAAAENHLLPREMQSITWEAIRSLFSRKFKGSAANVDAINSLWEDVSSGKITADEARQRALKFAGGFDRPAWFKGRWDTGLPKGKGTPGQSR